MRLQYAFCTHFHREIGKSPNLRHVKRLHDISLEWFHDCHKQGIFALKYCPSHLQVADMMTKVTHDPQTWRSLLRLACLFPTTDEPPPFTVYDGLGTTGRGDQIDEHGNIINKVQKVKIKCLDVLSYNENDTARLFLG